jgi:hypothetical protein
MVCTERILEYTEDARPMRHTQNGQDVEIWTTDRFPGKPVNECVKIMTAGYDTPEYREHIGRPCIWFEDIIVLNSSTATANPDIGIGGRVVMRLGHSRFSLNLNELPT